jgi:hypothetical protein
MRRYLMTRAVLFVALVSLSSAVLAIPYLTIQ